MRISLPLATSLAASLGLGSAAFGQAGVEGQYDLLFTQKPTAPAAAPVMVAAALPTVVPALPPVPPRPEPAPAVAPVAKVVTAPAPAAAPAPRPPAAATDYDFGAVLTALRNSTHPLSEEIQGSFRRFAQEMDEAIALMRKGRTREAIDLSSHAVDGVLQSRDAVVNPLWEAQFFVNAQIAAARAHLAGSLERADAGSAAARTEAQTARMLDTIAARIAATKDPVRRQQLTAHYRTIRTLEKVRHTSLSMSPDQRTFWLGVVQTLEQAGTAHQQVLMGCETMYAQLDSTSTQLRDYQGLLKTLDGVDSLLGSVDRGGMAGFVEGMQTLQSQMEGFSRTMQDSLEAGVADLDARVGELQATQSDAGSLLVPTEIDDELKTRLDRVGSTR